MKKAEEKKEKARFHQRKRAERVERKKVEFNTEEDTQKLQPRKKVSIYRSILA